MYNVAFPELNLYLNINPIAFSIFGKDVYWYGILIAGAIILGLLLARKQKEIYGIKYDTLEEFILWTMPVSIIFARIYYVAFSWNSYKDNLHEIFAIWHGGLAIYGGIIGAIFTALVFTRVKKIKIFDLLDYAVPYLALGQAIGRIGNFINREAYGEITNGILRMEILTQNGYISVHPTFLYESVTLLLIFLFLRLRERKFSGEQTAFYFLMYGAIRFFVEDLRSDSLTLFNIKVSMIVSAILIVTGISILVKNKIFKTQTDSEILKKEE